MPPPFPLAAWACLIKSQAMIVRKKWIGGALVVCAIALVIVFLPREVRPSIVSSGGAVIRFEGVVSGTNAFVFGNAFERAWGKVLGNRQYAFLGKRIGGPYIGSYGSPNPGFVFAYFSVTYANPADGVNLSIKLGQDRDAINDVGIAFLGSDTVFHATGSGSSGFGNRQSFATLDLFIPGTQQDTIRIVATSPSNSVELGRFEIPVR
jgi:hypothetical protein